MQIIKFSGRHILGDPPAFHCEHCQSAQEIEPDALMPIGLLCLVADVTAVNFELECYQCKGRSTVKFDLPRVGELALEEVEKLGYECVRELPNGRQAGIFPLMYGQAAVVADFDRDGPNGYWRYPRAIDARVALAAWDGEGEPPGPWAGRRGRIEGQAHGL